MLRNIIISLHFFLASNTFGMEQDQLNADYPLRKTKETVFNHQKTFFFNGWAREKKKNLLKISPSITCFDYYSQKKHSIFCLGGFLCGNSCTKNSFAFPIKTIELSQTIFLWQKQACVLNMNDKECIYNTLYTFCLYPCIGISVVSKDKVALIHADADTNFDNVGKFIKEHFSDQKSSKIHIVAVNKEFRDHDIYDKYLTQTSRIEELVDAIRKFNPGYACTVSLYEDNNEDQSKKRSLGVSLVDGVFQTATYVGNSFTPKDFKKITDSFDKITDKENTTNHYRNLYHNIKRKHKVSSITDFPLDIVDPKKVGRIDLSDTSKTPEEQLPNVFPTSHWKECYE